MSTMPSTITTNATGSWRNLAAFSAAAEAVPALMRDIQKAAQ